MSVTIGHATIDENGNISGGVNGDQTGKEVTLRAWYSKPWKYVLRFNDLAKGKRAAVAMKSACENANIGYNQSKRNTLRTEAKKVDFDLSKITASCACDCSSLISVCCEAAGISVPYHNGNAPTTSTIESDFEGTGEFHILTGKEYLLKSDNLIVGDILLAPGSHVAMVVSRETNSDFGGDDMVLPQIANGSSGDVVKAWQMLLTGYGYAPGNGGIDGIFGSGTKSATVKLQKFFGISQDGIVGPDTWGHALGVK